MSGNRKFRDTLFKVVFSRPKYSELIANELLRPKKRFVASEIETVTLRSTIEDGAHNDLGLLMRNNILLLVEAQTSHISNIALRCLEYTVDTLRQMRPSEFKGKLSQRRQLTLPSINLYVLYSKPGAKPSLETLSSSCSGHTDVEVCVHVITDSSASGVSSEYFQACGIYSRAWKEVRNNFGSREAHGELADQVADLTIRRCLSAGIFVDVLHDCADEVRSAIASMAYEDEIFEAGKDEGLATGREQGIQQGLVAGRERARYEMAAAILTAINHGLTREEAMRQLDILAFTPEEIEVAKNLAALDSSSDAGYSGLFDQSAIDSTSSMDLEAALRRRNSKNTQFTEF